MTDLNKLMKQSPKKDLRRFLRQEISLQKLLHPNDAKERPFLYKMNFSTPEQMIENLTILLTVPEENENRAKDIIFPSEEEIIDILKENGESFSNTTVTNNSTFYQQQPIAVVWDQDEGSRYWCIAFYLGTSDLEDCIIVDILQRLKKSGSSTEWIRPTRDDVQHIHPQWVIPSTVEGNWNFETRHAIFQVSNANNIESLFQELFS